FNGQDISNSSESRVFSKRMPCKSTIPLNETLGFHGFKCSLLHQRKSRLSELCRRQQSGRRDKFVESRVFIDSLKNWNNFTQTVRIDLFVNHIEIVLTNRFTLGTTEIHSEFLGIVADNIDDGKAVMVKEMFVRSVPDRSGDSAGFV